MRTRDFLFGLGMALLCSQVVNAQENRQRHQRMSKEEMQEMDTICFYCRSIYV